MIKLADELLGFISNNSNTLVACASMISIGTAFLAIAKTSEANALKLLPIIYISITLNEKNKPIFTLHNSGSGVAYDIQIEVGKLIDLEHKDKYEIKLWIPNVNILPPGEDVPINYKTYLNGKADQSVAFFIACHLAPDSFLSHMNLKDEINIKFRDALGRQYYTMIISSPKGTRIIKTARRLWIGNRISIFVLESIKNIYLEHCYYRKERVKKSLKNKYKSIIARLLHKNNTTPSPS